MAAAEQPLALPPASSALPQHHVSTSPTAAPLRDGSASNQSLREGSVTPRSSSPWTKHVSSNTEISNFPSKVVNGVITTVIPEEIRVDPPLWSECLVGFFIGDPPHIGKVHATVNRIWKPKDLKMMIDAQYLNSTTVLFRVPSLQSRQWILRRRFWFVGDAPLVVQQWSPTVSNLTPDLSDFPLWVDLHNVPDYLFSRKGLKHLTNLFGRFQKIHPNTERCIRLDVARVMVSIDLNQPLPEQIVLEQEESPPIMVSYPWLPKKCSSCNRWGHKQDSCTKRDTEQQDGNQQVHERGLPAEHRVSHDHSNSESDVQPVPEAPIITDYDRQQQLGQDLLQQGSPFLTPPSIDQPLSIEQIKDNARHTSPVTVDLPSPNANHDEDNTAIGDIDTNDQGWSKVQRGHKNSISPNRIQVNLNTPRSDSSFNLLASLGEKEEGEIAENPHIHTSLMQVEKDNSMAVDENTMAASTSTKSVKRNGSKQNRTQPPLFPHKAITHVHQQIKNGKASLGKRK